MWSHDKAMCHMHHMRHVSHDCTWRHVITHDVMWLHVTSCHCTWWPCDVMWYHRMSNASCGAHDVTWPSCAITWPCHMMGLAACDTHMMATWHHVHTWYHMYFHVASTWQCQLSLAVPNTTGLSFRPGLQSTIYFSISREGKLIVNRWLIIK